MKIRLVIGCQCKQVLRNEVNAHRMSLRCQNAGDECQFFGPAGNIAGLLRDNQVYSSRKAVIQEPAPFRRALHAWSRDSGIYIEVYQLPIGTQ